MKTNAKEQATVFLVSPDISEMSADKLTPPEVTIMSSVGSSDDEHNTESPAQDQSVSYAGQNPQPLRLVHSGIDKLYIGYYVTVNEEILSYLEEKMSEAKDSLGMKEVVVNIGETAFTMSSKGLERYAYVLTNSSLEIWIASSNSLPYPNVYVQFKSIMLLEMGAQESVTTVKTLITEHLGLIYGEKVSRVDMYADFAGVPLSLADQPKFVSVATTRAAYSKGPIASGFSFGKGRIQCKVYDKVAEIKKRKKEYMYSVWSGVSENEPVWRVEFQLLRHFLSQCSIESFSTFLSKAGSIWRYLTERWLSHRNEDNANTTRRTVTSFWRLVQSVSKFYGTQTPIPLVRAKKRLSSLTHLIKMMKGCLTSVGAHLSKENPGITLESVINWVVVKVKEELAGIKEGQEENTEEHPEVFLEERASKEFAKIIKLKAVSYA